MRRVGVVVEFEDAVVRNRCWWCFSGDVDIDDVDNDRLLLLVSINAFDGDPVLEFADETTELDVVEVFAKNGE